MLPVLFLSHGGGPGIFADFKGSPFQAIDMNSPSAKFMNNLTNNHLPRDEIKSILVISAHWEEAQFSITYEENGATLVYDYYGFPRETYAPYLTYPAKSNKFLSQRVLQLLEKYDIAAKLEERGLDHGAFIPLKAAFPEANIPVVQLSLKKGLNIEEHLRLGEIIAPLRKEGVLIVCSGQITHNLSEIRRGGNKPDPRTVEFTEWIFNSLSSLAPTRTDYERVKRQYLKVREECPHFAVNHPEIEHFIPLCVALGTYSAYLFEKEQAAAAAVEEHKVERIYHEIVLGTMALDSYKF